MRRTGRRFEPNLRTALVAALIAALAVVGAAQGWAAGLALEAGAAASEGAPNGSADTGQDPTPESDNLDPDEGAVLPTSCPSAKPRLSGNKNAPSFAASTLVALEVPSPVP